MKVIIVCGFYDQVEAELRANFADALQSKSLLWIPGRLSGNIHRIKTIVLNKLQDGSASEVNILYAVLRYEAWADEAFKAMVQSFNNEYPGAMGYQRFADAQSSEPVIQALSELKLTANFETVSSEQA